MTQGLIYLAFVVRTVSDGQQSTITAPTCSRITDDLYHQKEFSRHPLDKDFVNLLTCWLQHNGLRQRCWNWSCHVIRSQNRFIRRKAQHWRGNTKVGDPNPDVRSPWRLRSRFPTRVGAPLKHLSENDKSGKALLLSDTPGKKHTKLINTTLRLKVCVSLNDKIFHCFLQFFPHQSKYLFVLSAKIHITNNNPLVFYETKIVLHPQWHVSLVFQARSSTVSVVCRSCSTKAKKESTSFHALCLNHFSASTYNIATVNFLSSAALYVCLPPVPSTQHFVLSIRTMAPLSYCQHWTWDRQPLKFLSCVYKHTSAAIGNTPTQGTYRCPALTVLQEGLLSLASLAFPLGNEVKPRQK